MAVVVFAIHLESAHDLQDAHHQRQFDCSVICVRFLNVLVTGKNEAGGPIIH
jgi:hypothetical protein